MGKEFKLSNLPQLAVNKAVEQHPDLIQADNVTDCLKQQNEIVQEVDNASCLLVNHNQRAEESVAIIGEPNTQFQELNRKLGELQDKKVKIVQEKVMHGKDFEKEVHGKNFEALHAELAKKNRELEEKIITLMKENEEQQNVIETLKAISEEKMILEEENAELGRRNLVLEEKQVHQEGRIADLEIALDSLTADLESCSQIADEKEGLFISLRYQLSDLVKENMYLEELNSGLVTELNKSTKVLEENVYLHHKIRELDISSHSLTEDLESKDMLLQQLTSEHQQLKSEYQHSQVAVHAE